MTGFRPVDLQDAVGLRGVDGAQLGKNYTEGANGLPGGDDLLSAACEKVSGIQRDLGGRPVYLECEDEPKLVSFYERNGFRRIHADDDGRTDGLLRPMKFL